MNKRNYGVGVVVLVSALSYGAFAQSTDRPALKAGIHVEMASAPHAVPMPDADANDAAIVSVKDTGELFIGVRASTLADVAKISAATVYVKADARVRFQSLLGVLDALHGHSVVLLAQPTTKPPAGQMVQPYGIALGSGR